MQYGFSLVHRIESLQKADLFLASALMRSIHPLKIFKMADVQESECLSIECLS
jgi:hypothetical protein